MACTSPLKAFYKIGNDGKKQITFYNSLKFSKPYELYPDDNKIDIPCGQCISCRLEYSRQWAIRCMLESSKYEYNYFITLTYNDESLFSECKKHNFKCDHNGEIVSEFDSFVLMKSHLQQFMKNLRRYFEYHFNFTGIRFFACGEYGPSFLRPHFHIILFNCPIPDLTFLKSNFQGDVYWTSEIIDKCWNSRGYHIIGNCNFSTCSYVARYMLKKQKGKSTYYDDLGLVPPFTLMSRAPGIARDYYDENSKKIYFYDNLVITNSKGVAQRVKPPKYFDRLYDIDFPEHMQLIKDRRSDSAKFAKKAVEANISCSYDEYLSTKEGIILSSTSKLKRCLE